MCKEVEYFKRFLKGSRNKETVAKYAILSGYSEKKCVFIHLRLCENPNISWEEIQEDIDYLFPDFWTRVFSFLKGK